MSSLRIITTCVLLLVVSAATAPAAIDEEIDAMLDAKQLELQAELEHSLIAPCCWNMTVDQHESPAAKKVRLQIAELVKEGQDKEEILDYFVAQPQYGERILATPSQDTLLGKSAYWLTPIAMAFGGLIVVVAIRSLLKPRGQADAETAKTSAGAATKDPSDLHKRVEEELSRFDT